MARFSPFKIAFGKPPPDDFEGEADPLPKPAAARQAARRTLAIKEATETLAALPDEGESLHCLCTARMDLTDAVEVLLERYGACKRIVVATLGYNERNLATLLSWFDSKRVAALVLLSSIFFRSHKGDLWEQTLREFRSRGQQAACCHSHAKVVCLDFGATKLSIEGSANLCGNGSGREQFALFNGAALHDWHAAWITELVGRHAPPKNNAEG